MHVLCFHWMPQFVVGVGNLEPYVGLGFLFEVCVFWQPDWHRPVMEGMGDE